MKLITAVIQPHKLDDVRAALGDIGIQGMTVTEARGFGRQRGHREVYRGAEYIVDFLPKAKLEIAIDDDMVGRAIDAIEHAAKTGNVGDGKDFCHRSGTSCSHSNRRNRTRRTLKPA